jgi:hypothetical protein
MTREEIERMEAGRELDTLIAEKVMKLDVRKSESWVGDLTSLGSPGQKVTFIGEFTEEREWVEEGDYFWKDDEGASHVLPDYSTDIGAAWQVVEKIVKNNGSTVSFGYSGRIVNRAHVTIDRTTRKDLDLDFWVEANTMPLAICRAALLACEVMK